MQANIPASPDDCSVGTLEGFTEECYNDVVDLKVI